MARIQRVVVEYGEDGWLAMFADGVIRAFATAADASRAIRAAARRGNASVTVTSIDWRNTPPDFVPPVEN